MHILIAILLLSLIMFTFFLLYRRIPSYKGAGIALFREKDGKYELFLGLRKYNPGKNKWSIPGGGYESYDNSLDVTAKREFTEELSLDFNKLDASFVNEVKIILPKYKWSTFCYVLNKDIRLSQNIHEFSALKFIPVENLENLDLNLFVRTEVSKFLKAKSK